jgi:hypothetical protein
MPFPLGESLAWVSDAGYAYPGSRNLIAAIDGDKHGCQCLNSRSVAHRSSVDATHAHRVRELNDGIAGLNVIAANQNVAVDLMFEILKVMC